MAQPRPKARGPRPNVWRSGPDLERHDQYISWGRSRAQAHYRGETWQLTYEEYCDIWGDRWCQRGRQGTSLCLTRLDPSRPWSRENSVLQVRKEVLRQQGDQRRARRAKNKKKNRPLPVC